MHLVTGLHKLGKRHVNTFLKKTKHAKIVFSKEHAGCLWWIPIMGQVSED